MLNETKRMQQLAGILKEDISEKTPKKGDIVLPTGKFADEWFISKVTEKEVSITKLPTTTHNIPIEKFLKDYKWDNEIKRWKK